MKRGGLESKTGHKRVRLAMSGTGASEKVEEVEAEGEEERGKCEREMNDVDKIGSEGAKRVSMINA